MLIIGNFENIRKQIKGNADSLGSNFLREHTAITSEQCSGDFFFYSKGNYIPFNSKRVILRGPPAGRLGNQPSLGQMARSVTC